MLSRIETLSFIWAAVVGSIPRTEAFRVGNVSSDLFEASFGCDHPVTVTLVFSAPANYSADDLTKDST